MINAVPKKLVQVSISHIAAVLFWKHTKSTKVIRIHIIANNYESIESACTETQLQLKAKIELSCMAVRKQLMK